LAQDIHRIRTKLAKEEVTNFTLEPPAAVVKHASLLGDTRLAELAHCPAVGSPACCSIQTGLAESGRIRRPESQESHLSSDVAGGGRRTHSATAAATVAKAAQGSFKEVQGQLGCDC